MHPQTAYQYDSVDSHIILKMDLGRPGGLGPLTSPNKSFLGNLQSDILKV